MADIKQYRDRSIEQWTTSKVANQYRKGNVTYVMAKAHLVNRLKWSVDMAERILTDKKTA
jgi:pyruvate/2-oxoglutarate dehydrogenase complex dihydrolipoamide dehydrogenase (E3) component